VIYVFVFYISLKFYGFLQYRIHIVFVGRDKGAIVGTRSNRSVER